MAFSERQKQQQKKKNKYGDTAGNYSSIPYCVIEHKDYVSLSSNARSLLAEIIFQYNGKNNGYLSATINQLKPRGWSSESTLDRAKKELIKYGMIICTQRGQPTKTGRKPNLYALTWKPIDNRPNNPLLVEHDGKPFRNFPQENLNNGSIKRVC